MTYQWTENTRPDRPGIWMLLGSKNAITVYERDLSHDWFVGSWCFLMDLPEIKDPPKYREVTAADVGKMVEVGDRDGEWQKRKLVAVIPGNVQGKYVVESDGDLGWTWFYVCRILDDGEPATTLPIGDDYERFYPSSSSDMRKGDEYLALKSNGYACDHWEDVFASVWPDEGRWKSRIVFRRPKAKADDGEPAKQPREWWFCKQDRGMWSRHEVRQKYHGEQIHVREVIDESAS